MDGEMSRNLEVGKWNKLPHYAVIGNPQDFYVWVNEDKFGSNSGWIKGAKAFEAYNKLANLHKKDRVGFVTMVKALYKTYAKAGSY